MLSASRLGLKCLVPFNRETYNENDMFTYIGDSRLGGKARRLAVIKERMFQYPEILNRESHIPIEIPRLTVITTQYFDQFLEENQLFDIAYSDLGDDEIARHFLKSPLPQDLVDDLRVFLEVNTNPLAVRSSALMEDSLNLPFAGIYRTKMIPNTGDLRNRLRTLVEAVKLVYASTFFSVPKCCMKSVSQSSEEEKMAVIVQEVMGIEHHGRYYPNISGVARSYNFYPSGHAKPDDGVVSLALGLGKAIVDGGDVWTYSPRYPDVTPPYASASEMLNQTQLDFWSIRKGEPFSRNPQDEEEFLVRLSMAEAEKDNTLGYISSSYDFGSDSVKLGIGFGGPKVIDFAPLLNVDLLPVNEMIKSILELCEYVFRAKVEIEFAVNICPTEPPQARFGLFQVRPMAVFEEFVDIDDHHVDRDKLMVASYSVMGNGSIDFIRDVVYVKPEMANLAYPFRMAGEVEAINRELVQRKVPYVLIGFGRWGSTQPSLGVPVNWGQICGARVIVEVGLSNAESQLSQGSHFFHNIANLKIPYFSLKKDDKVPVDWEWLRKQRKVGGGKYLRHVRLKQPLLVKVDGRKRNGVILKNE